MNTMLQKNPKKKRVCGSLWIDTFNTYAYKFSKIPSLCWEFINFREHEQGGVADPGSQ